MVRPRRDSPRDSLAVALPIVLVALLLIGATAVFLAAVREQEDADKRQEEATELVRTDVAATIDELLASLAGTAAIVDDDNFGVGIERWEEFAREVDDVSVINSLGLEIIVSDRNRAAFEALIGGPILEEGPDGELVPAAARPTYLPVRSIVPLTDQNRSLIGFDIASDATRGRAAQAARDAGRVVISAPVTAQTTRLPSFFVVKPLYRLGALLDTREQRITATMGYVTTAVSGQSVIDAALPLLPGGTRFSIRDDDVLLGSTAIPPQAGRTSTISIAGRDWVLLVDDGSDPNHTLAWLLGIATLLLAATVAATLRTRIHAQRQHAADAERHARGADLAQRLAEARTTVAVAEAVHNEVPHLLGALNASVRTLDDSKQVLQAVIDEELPAALAASGGIPVSATSPPGRAVQEHKWILLEDVARASGEYRPDVLALLTANGFRALASIPLEDAEGSVVGLLGVTWDKPRRFDDTTMALLRTIAELCEQTLERARLHDSEHLLVQRLQNEALSAPPTLERLEMSVRYQSAVQTLSMGGDWYDAIVLDDHTVALVVGDVAGHGVPAIAEMIELRSAIHALLRAHHPIDQVFTVADSILSSGDRTRIATALVAVFDSRAECVQYVSAGHPPAILRSPEGDVEVMMDGRRTVLGVPPTNPCAIARRRFAKGWTFVAYTDGLVERRREDILVSVDRLAADLGSSELQGEQLADAILLAHAPAEVAGDDIALVVVHGV
jgi:serine phosphatase RsbU (regulator of sigma subunit)/CHASE1-domain containing sensor protein